MPRPKPKPADPEGLPELFAEYARTREPELRNRLISRHMSLVHSVARKFAGMGESFDDLLQEGAMGLINAVDLYDPGRAVKFSTYATHLISGQIQHYLRDKSRIIREPAWVQELYSKLTRTVEAQTQKLKRPPTPAEIAREMNLTEQSVTDLLQSRQRSRVASLEASVEKDDDDLPSLLDREQTRTGMGSDAGLAIEERILIDESVQKLKDMEQKIIELFFYEDLTQTEIARKLGISVNYASYLLKRAVAKLQADVARRPAAEEEARTRAEENRAAEERLPVVDEVADPLTGCYSAQYFQERVRHEALRAQRYPQNFALLYLESDSTEAAPPSDETLRHLGALIRRRTRRVDLIGRVGTGRFGLLLPHTGREARVLADRLCVAVREAGSGGGQQPSITVSIGYAVFPKDGQAAGDLAAAAQQALQQAQREGGNRALRAGGE
jgi:RNA polymerase sigma-B factor